MTVGTHHFEKSLATANNSSAVVKPTIFFDKDPPEFPSPFAYRWDTRKHEQTQIRVYLALRPVLSLLPAKEP